MIEAGTKLRLRRDDDGTEFSATVIDPAAPPAFVRLSQRDPRWALRKLGLTTGLENIGSHGCLITCFTMMLGRSDVGALNDELCRRNMFVAGSGNVYLDLSALGAKLLTVSSLYDRDPLPDVWQARLMAHVRAGKPAIVGVDFSPWPANAQYDEHYVYVTGLDDQDRLTIADPWPLSPEVAPQYFTPRYGRTVPIAACRVLLYERIGVSP